MMLYDTTTRCHNRKETTMASPRSTALRFALQEQYIRNVAEALQTGREDDAVSLAQKIAAEMGLVRVA